MGDVITRFKLETSNFDSKLRDTAKALQGIAHQAELGGKDFNKFNDEAIKSARALGTVQSGANNTKDKLRDLVGSYNDAAKAYNSLTETAKKGEFGQAMSQSLTQLQQRIRETKEELYGLGDGMKGASGGSLFSSDKLSGMLQVFGGNVMTKVAGMGVGFASELKDMVAQGIELAKAGEGVRLAFQRLGRGDILQGLREATHGTVTDLELMKAAVKFNDFKLPLDELGTMLAFAQQKAKDTGQSVDYMVDSIVTGLGRKSLMILDNLGLSAAEIKERMAETGDMTKAVGAIIREQMSKAGDYVETAADRATQANVELENAMTRLGETFQPLSDSANSMWTDIKVGALDLLNNAIKPLIDRLTEAGRLRAQLNNINAGTGTNQTRAGKDLGYLKYEIGKYGANDPRITDLYNRQRGRYIQQENQAWRQSQSAHQRYENLRKNGGSQADINAYYQRWQTMEAQAKAWGSVLKEYDEGFKKLTTSAKVNVNTDEAEQNITSLTKKLKDLQAERKKAIASGDKQKSADLLKQINQTKADIKGLGGTTTTTTTKQTPQQRAQESFTKAEQNYKQALEQAAMELQAGTITRAEAKKKEMQAAEARWKAIGDARNINDSDRLRKAQDEAASEYTRLAGEVKQMDDAIKAAKIKWETGASGFNAETMTAWMKGRQGDLQHANYGTEAYNNIAANIADMTTIKTIIEQRLKAGMEAADTDGIMEQLWERVFDGEDIPDEVWQSLTDKINEKLKEMKLDPLKIDFKTGEVAKTEKDNKKNDDRRQEAIYGNISRIAGSVQGMLSTLETMGIEIPDELQSMVSGIQSIMEFMSAMTALITTIAGTSTIKALPIIGAFAHNGAVIHAAGGAVTGNTYSGDKIPAMLNAGEVVLNRAQTGNIASQLSGNNGGGQNAQPYVTGDIIYMGLMNYLQENGYGKLMTTNMR